MNLMIQHSSMIPIYEQIVDQLKNAILKGNLREEEPLPSVRTLSKDLRVSALTVKKAYDFLETEGLIITVHGKGSFVARVNPALLTEERQKEVEADLERAIQKGRSCGMTKQELTDLFHLLLED